MKTQSAVTIILMKVAYKTYSNQKQFNLSLIYLKHLMCMSLR